MINYRLYTADDFDKVDALCAKNDMPFPVGSQFLVIAENDQGEIISICGLKKEIKIEPLISENPICAVNLVRMVEGIAIGQEITKLYSEIPKNNVKHIKQAEKDGWVIVSNNRIKLEKSYG